MSGEVRPLIARLSKVAASLLRTFSRACSSICFGYDAVYVRLGGRCVTLITDERSLAVSMTVMKGGRGDTDTPATVAVVERLRHSSEEPAGALPLLAA